MDILTFLTKNSLEEVSKFNRETAREDAVYWLDAEHDSGGGRVDPVINKGDRIYLCVDGCAVAYFVVVAYKNREDVYHNVASFKWIDPIEVDARLKEMVIGWTESKIDNTSVKEIGGHLDPIPIGLHHE